LALHHTLGSEGKGGGTAGRAGIGHGLRTGVVTGADNDIGGWSRARPGGVQRIARIGRRDGTDNGGGMGRCRSGADDGWAGNGLAAVAADDAGGDWLWWRGRQVPSDVVSVFSSVPYFGGDVCQPAEGEYGWSA
jgi:hypothetical protein